MGAGTKARATCAKTAAAASSRNPGVHGMVFGLWLGLVLCG